MKDVLRITLTFGTVIAIVVTSIYVMDNPQLDRATLFIKVLTVTYSITFSIGTMFVIAEYLLSDRIHYQIISIICGALGSVSGLFLAFYLMGLVLPNERFFYDSVSYLIRVMPPFVVMGVVITMSITYIEHRKEAKEQELIEEKKRADKLSQHKDDAIVQSLQSRLNPHFLFNTLNGIAELIYQSPELAEKTVLNLSELYRETLNMSEKKTVTVKEELDLLKKYLDIEAIRFQDRLSYSMDIDPNAANEKIPVLIIQPFVENAITKGIARKHKGGTVDICARKKDGVLVFRIEDTGAGFDSFVPGNGTTNVLDRLNLIYGKGYAFDIHSRLGEGTVVDLLIPVEERL